MTAWGKAGFRLTEQERATRAATRAREAGKWQMYRAQHEEEAFRLWRAGRLVPAMITTALGDRSGPEVDTACGAMEPDVDHWEAGILYPTWEQVKLLAELCNYPIRGLFREPLPIGQVFACGPGARGWKDLPPPILAFTQDAVARRLRGETETLW